MKIRLNNFTSRYMQLRVYDSKIDNLLIHSTNHPPGSVIEEYDSNYILNTTVEWQYSGREEPLIAYPELMRKVPYPAPTGPDGKYL